MSFFLYNVHRLFSRDERIRWYAWQYIQLDLLLLWRKVFQ